MNDARDQLLSRIMPKVESACDLACGTGTTALSMARQGIKMYAVDRSPAMCRLTREKAKRAGLPLRVLRSDMRSFKLPRTVDLITCEFDALNHIPNVTDLKTVADTVASALNPGGHFFFDVNTSHGFDQYWTGAVWFEKPGVVLVMRNGNNPEADRAWSDIEWFIKQGSQWTRYQERVEEVCWSAREIRRTFRDAGFDQIRSWDAAPFFQDDPLIGPGCRTVYLARKAK